jgi:hypothetical protein
MRRYYNLHVSVVLAAARRREVCDWSQVDEEYAFGLLGHKIPKSKDIYFLKFASFCLAHVSWSMPKPSNLTPPMASTHGGTRG